MAAGLVLASPAQAQVGRIVGRVTDATSGAPVSEVQVYIPGLSIGSLSRANGAFILLNVPVGTHELRAERIGLAAGSEQVTVVSGQAAEVQFELSTQALGLDEIVVTGAAGAARRREVGSAIAQINAADLPERPTSVSDMLQSTAPGIEVVSGGGETGQGSVIRLRGVNSVNPGGNMNVQPIIYIDGVRMMSTAFPTEGAPDYRPGRTANVTPSPLDGINPADIERIEVIKGSAATTLYGTEASGGVIQVFTKKGAMGSPVWSAETHQGTMWSPRYGANGVDYLWMDPWTCTGIFQCGERTHQAWTQQYSLSVRGGAQTLQYFLSGQYEDEAGNMPNDFLEKYNVRGNFTFTPITNVTVQFNTAYQNQWQSNTPVGNNSQGLTLNVFRQDQNYYRDSDPDLIDKLLVWDIQSQIERFTTGGTVTYAPTPSVSNRLTVGYDFSEQVSRNIRPFGFIAFPQGGLDNQTYSRRFLTFDYVGSYDFDVTSSVGSTFSWGGQAIGDQRNLVEAWGEGFPGAVEPTVNSASSTLGYEEMEKIWNAGFFLQNVFDIANRYFVTVGARVDGNSAFGKGFGLQVYPKASATWVISDESFWRPAFGQIKLRTAYGQSGRAPGAFDAVRTWENVGLGGEAAFVPENVGNAELGPEVTAELEGGFDASWLSDRIRTTFTYYRQTTSDALLEREQIASLGFTQEQPENVGKLLNQGTEFSLDLSPIQGARWGWDVGVNHSWNSSEILEHVDSEYVGRPIAHNDDQWTTFRNPDAMGTFVRPDGTRSARSCFVDRDGVQVPREGVGPGDACTIESDQVYGRVPELPTTIINGYTTIRMPYGISLSARGEFRGGNWATRNPISISRSVRAPACFPYYANDEDVKLKTDTPAIWVHRCTPGLGEGYNHEADYFKLRSVSATIPMEFAFPDRIQTATLTVVLGNPYTWAKGLYGAYGIESLGNEGANETDLGNAERIPPSTTLRASLRVTF